MRCLNCGQNALALNTEICPKCNAYLPSLMRDLLPAGKLLNHNKYRIDYPLGRGGFGVTYRGIHTDLEQPVAIKEFYPIEQASRYGETTQLIVPKDKEAIFSRGIKRFLKEAKILNTIEHPNIVRVRDYFRENNTAYIVMSLISGTTLGSLIKAEPNNCLSPEKVQEIISVLVEALATIHAASIYHLDIKPENILITEKGKIVLVDFGASKQGMGSHSTQAFTLSYAPPEVIGGGEVGAHSDIFELGVLLYEMLTGKQPPNSVDRLVKDNFSAKDLQQPWQSLVESALKLSDKERPSQIKKWWGNNFDRVDLKRDLAAINLAYQKTIKIPRSERELNNDLDRKALLTTGFKSAGILVAAMALAVMGTQILSSFDSTINDTKSVTQNNPSKEAENYYKRGNDYRDRKEWDLAIENYTKAIEIAPNLASAYGNRAYAYNEQKKWDLAFADANKAIEIDPNLASAYGNRGRVYYNQKKKRDLAFTDFNRAIQLDPNYALAYNGRGVVYSDQQKYDLALADYTKAIQLDPNYANAYNGRGSVYDDLQKYDLALADYNKAIQLDPNFAIAYNGRGVVYSDQQKYDLALADYTKAIQLDPNYAPTYNNRGAVYHNQQKWDLALADYNKAIQLDPNFAIAYNNRGLLYGNQEKWNLALIDYNKAIELDPNYANAYNNRGFVWSNLGDKQKEIKDFEKAAELYKQQGDMTNYERVMNRLAQIK